MENQPAHRHLGAGAELATAWLMNAQGTRKEPTADGNPAAREKHPAVPCAAS